MNANLRESPVARELAQRAIDRANESAIVTPQRSVTFEEIAHRTANLATSIADVDERMTWLPVFVDRGIDSTIAILSAIHAGVPFVPIDAGLPSTRVDQLLALVGRPRLAVIARPELAGVLPHEVRAVPLDARHHTLLSPVAVEPSTPGSLLFTSGSTGRAKGVVRTWCAVDRRLGEVVSQDESIRSSHLQPMNFSGGISKAIRIAAGETICMIDPRESSLDDLVGWLATVEITHARLGGGILDAILRRPDLDRWLPTVREISVFGSRRDCSQVPLIRRLCSTDVSIVNSYSATEVGNICQFKIDAESEVSTGRIPNGSIPIDRLKLVECEEGHEIWIRDPDALEYLGDPELSARRFVTDDDGVRWWRSGDLGRIDEEGHFYFTGRIDHMVKINGMRIEPEESEHALRSIPGIGSAAVVAQPTANGSHRLVGHVCIDDATLTPESIRAQLASMLPSHLVPAVLVRHDELPYTDRQKLDRQALLTMPLQRWATPAPKQEFSPQARWLASKVEQLIGLGRVEPNDDMWEAGLDSVGAVELCSLIAAEKWGKIDPRLLLEARTAETLEKHLGKRRGIDASHVVAFNASGSHLPIFAIPGTSGTAFAYRALSEALGPEQPVVVIEPKGMHTRERIERTIEERAASVVDEVNRRLGPDQPCLLIGHSGGVTIAFEAGHILTNAGRKVHLLLLDGVPRDLETRNPTKEWTKKLQAEKRRLSSSATLVHWVVSVLRRAPRKVWVRSMRSILVRFPGKRRHSIDHYKHFWWISGRAVKKYILRPLDAPATLLHVGKQSMPERCAPWFSSLESHLVRGDHNSMMYPPHIGETAEHVVRLRNTLLRVNA